MTNETEKQTTKNPKKSMTSFTDDSKSLLLTATGREKVSYTRNYRQQPFHEPEFYTQELQNIFSAVKFAVEQINETQKTKLANLASQMAEVAQCAEQAVAQLQVENDELRNKLAADRKLFENYSVSVSNEFAKLEKRLAYVEQKK